MKHSFLSLSARMILLQMVLLTIVGCSTDTTIYQQEHINFPIKGVLCKASKDSIMCQTITGAQIYPLAEYDNNVVVPNNVLSYDIDDFEVLSNVDQYIHLDPDCTDSVVIQLADLYNALMMHHSIMNDLEVTERYEESTAKTISQMNCSVLHNPELRNKVEKMRDANAKYNKNNTQTNLNKVEEATDDVFETLMAMSSPILDKEKEKYFAVCDRSPYLTNFAEFDSLRGTGNKKYQKRLLATYNKTENMDLKCIWALEFAHSAKKYEFFVGGIALLEEVMLSKKYSPYLDEIWATWRAEVSLLFPPSNYGYIPNLFYNEMRLTCATTILDYIKENHDDRLAQAIFINIIGRENIVRHGAPLGNSSAVEQMTIFSEWNK